MTNNSNTRVSIQGIANKGQITNVPEQKAINEIQVVFEVTNGYYTLGFTNRSIQVPQNERSLNVIPQSEVTEMKTLIQIIYVMIFGTDSLTEGNT
jgi:hypothetical protein